MKTANYGLMKKIPIRNTEGAQRPAWLPTRTYPMILLALFLLVIFSNILKPSDPSDFDGMRTLDRNDLPDVLSPGPTVETEKRDDGEYRGEATGRATLFPNITGVCSRERLNFTFVPPPGGIARGGSVVFEFHKEGGSLVLLGYNLSSDDPALNFDVERSSVMLDVSRKVCLQVVLEGKLRPDDRLYLEIDAQIGLVAHSVYFPVWVDTDGDGNFSLIKTPPELRIEGGPAAVLMTTLPAETIPGKEATLTVTAFDRFGNAARDFDQTISFSSTDPGATVDGRLASHRYYTFKPDIDRGVHNFRIEFSEVGVHRVRAGLVYDTGPISVGNPTACKNYTRKYDTLFGDLQFHTRLSDAVYFISLPEAYHFARNVNRLDFAASTDHAECFDKTGIPFYSEYVDHLDEKIDDWEYIKQITAETNEEENFTALLGFEWSQRGNAGDRTVYYPDDKGPAISGLKQPFDPSKPFEYWRDRYVNVTDLWDALAAGIRRGEITDALTVPHTSMAASPGAGTNWEFHNETFEELVEIYSVHGNNEYPGCEEENEWGFGPRANGSVRYALGERGRRLGIIANTDSHAGHPGMNDWLPSTQMPGGLTAVLAEENSREAIWEALKARRCYGTTGVRTLLNFTVDGHYMGEEYRTGEPPAIHVEVAGTSNISRIEILKNAASDTPNVIRRYEGNGTEVALDIVDDTFSEEGEETSYYYVKVVQEDGEMAWSSPVWVNFEPYERSTDDDEERKRSGNGDGLLWWFTVIGALALPSVIVLFLIHRRGDGGES